MSLKTNARDHQDAGEQPALREADQGTRADAEGADEGHGVGADPQTQQEVADRRPDVGPELAEAFEHGGSRVSVRRARCRIPPATPSAPRRQRADPRQGVRWGAEPFRLPTMEPA